MESSTSGNRGFAVMPNRDHLNVEISVLFLSKFNCKKINEMFHVCFY